MSKAMRLFTKMRPLLRDSIDHGHMLSILFWDEETTCPPSALRYRERMISRASLEHLRAMTNPALGRAIDEVSRVSTRLPETEERIVWQLSDTFRDMSSIPESFYAK